jgi:hypothetical protein
LARARYALRASIALRCECSCVEAPHRSDGRLREALRDVGVTLGDVKEALTGRD